MSIKNILVPVDFSELSHKAVEYATLLAKKFDSEITLLHIIILSGGDINEINQLKSYDEFMHMREDEKRRNLENISNKVQSKGIEVNKELLKGFSVVDSILNYIKGKNFDLLVMGTHGHTGLKRLLLGSVAEKVSYDSPIPVISIHKNFEKMKLKKLLVPVDFSDYSKMAIQQGFEIAKDFSAKLELLHVVEEDEYPDIYNLVFFPILRAKPSIKSKIINKLKMLAGIPQGKKIYYVVKEGKIHKEIKKYAKSNKVDLIVMHHRSRSQLDHFFFGSNTERVVRIAPCPVLCF